MRKEGRIFNIGVDVLGGDNAPSEILRGALQAHQELGQKITLIGPREEIEKEARLQGIDLSVFEMIEAEEKIEMAESPASAVRRKKKSSIVVGTFSLKEKKIDAFVSCGNTGAVVCASTIILGLIEGIERPGIGILLPTLGGISLVIDVGANIDPKPIHLFQYGLMASLYYSLVLGKEKPLVGLLNIGEEETKGTEFIKETYRLFSNSSLNFIGNLEAKDIFFGKCDCIICDGYVGNVALKVSEGLAEAMGKFLLASIKRDFWGRLAAFFIQKSLKKIKKLIDYTEYGGAPLLGVDGVVIIGHGRSNSYAVKNAIGVAIQELRRDLNTKIKKKLEELPSFQTS